MGRDGSLKSSSQKCYLENSKITSTGKQSLSLFSSLENWAGYQNYIYHYRTWKEYKTTSAYIYKRTLALLSGPSLTLPLHGCHDSKTAAYFGAILPLHKEMQKMQRIF